MAEQETATKPRAEKERTERRRRKAGGTTSPLQVTDEIAEKLAQEGKEGRWINDVDNRIHDKTKNDDWDKVPGVEPRVVGKDKRTGEKITAYYCSKPTEFLEADRAERAELIKAREQAMVRGNDNTELDEGSYQPAGKNRIGNEI